MGDTFAKGVNGQISISGDWLTIARRGFGRIGHSKGDRRIPMATITAVQVRPAGPLVNGFIRFSVPGSPDLRGGLKNAGEDENAVIFTRKHSTEFDAVRDQVEAFISAHLAGMRHVARTTDEGVSDPMESIRRPAELKGSGAITEAEFEAKKKELLDRL